MLDRIIKASLKNRLLVIIAGVALLVVGAFTVTQIPVDVFPDLTAPTVVILTEAHGMATEEVETMVTFPIETAANGATGVRRVRSSSAMGISIIWVEFDWGTDIFIARQIVNEKLQLISAQLPTGVSAPVLAPISSIMGEIMLVSVASDNHSQLDVRTVADWTIRKRLLAVPGVSQVVPIGGGRKQYQVLVDPDKLLSYNVSVEDVLHAVEESNANSSGGVFMEKGQEYLIRGLGRVYSVDDIGISVVTVRNNVPILVSDVAEIKIDAATKIGDGSVNAKPAVVISIQKQPGANTLELTERIEVTLADIQKTLPEGMNINSHIFRQSDFIQIAINNILAALRDGAILVIIILILFLGNVRTTFISLTAMPLSLIFAIFVMKFFDITINTMTLGGMAIAIGAIVDDAIIDVENVFRRLKENSKKEESERHPTFDVIFDASREIRSSIVNATLIIIVVFLPLFFLSGVEGRLLAPLGIAYIASIGASLIVALTITPALCFYLLPRAKFMAKDGDSTVVSVLKRMYLKTLNRVLAKPTAILIGAAIALVVALAILPFLGRAFLPEFNEGSLTISVVTMPGTSLDESNKLGNLVEQILLEHPCIKSTARRTGRAELDEHAQGVNSAELDARFELDDRSKEQMLNELRKSLTVVPGTNITIGQPLGHRIDHMLSGTRANIAVKIFGSDLQRLRLLAETVRKQMETVEGVADLAVEQQMDVPQIRIKANRLAMAKYGMTVADFSEAIDVAFNGEVVSQVLEGQKSFDLLVRYNDNHRGSIEKIKQALFDTPSGKKIPIQELATITSEKGANSISRENVQRKIVVQANVAGRDLRSVIEDIQKLVGANVSFPEGYYVEYGGQFESEQRATRIIALLSLAAILAIYLILYLEFRSFKTALLVMVNLPLALIGGVIAVFFSNGIISIASLVGFITLFGIATRNGILMVSHYNHLIEEGVKFREAIVRGSLERLSPILMTALSAGLALIPLAIAGSEPGNEIQSPMAIVILGGLLSSTALNMIVIPALYVKFGNRK
ncbi:MAG: efflux RND transporter permease subunit [Ignavibacteriae bacterium]|nr:efflux RND transporter permease subunit [Ignavibacteriota bacterium]